MNSSTGENDTAKAKLLSSLWRSVPPIVWDIAWILLLLLVVSIASMRLSKIVLIPGDPQGSAALGKNGLADFQDVIYYPSKAVREGVNPYDCGTEPRSDGSLRYRQRYPVLNHFPLYSPLLIILYWPFSYFDFSASALAYVVVNLVLLIGFACLCWQCVDIRPSVGQATSLASVILATQAGRANFLGGETAIPLALASLASIRLAERHPYLAGFALAITSFKPTFGIPLGILLLACGHWRTVAIGWTIGFAVGVIGLVLIFSRSGDLERLPEILAANQQLLEADPDGNAASSAIRMDSASALVRISPWQGKWVPLAAFLLVIGPACWGLNRLRKFRSHPESQFLETSIVGLTTVTCIFHITYDGILLWGAIACIALSPHFVWVGATARWRWSTAALLFLPMVNLLGTNTFINLQMKWLPWLSTLSPSWQQAGWTLICTANGLALLAALYLLVGRACRIAQPAAE
ncbi:MAG: glycosyltransferase family 87 protein [Pirellulaceae bacterium]